MEISVQSTTKESKQAQGKTYWGVKHTDGNWFNVITNDKPTQGQTLNVDVKTSEWNGKTYRWATINQKAQAKAGGNGHAAADWSDYKEMAMKAKDLAWMLEPDTTDQQPDANPIYLDRAVARAAIINTIMIAFSKGLIAVPEDDGPPPPGDDDVPF